MKKILLPETYVTRTTPVNLLAEDNIYFEREYERKIHSTDLYILNNVDVTEDGIVIQNGFVFPQSMEGKHLSKKFNWRYPIKVYLRQRKYEFREGVCGLIFDLSGNNYFHWMTGSISRLVALGDQSKELTLALPETFSRFHKLTLKPFQFKGLVSIPKDHYLRVENLVMPTHTAIGGNYNLGLIERERELYRKAFPKRIDFGERIYISREKAKVRRIVNESEVIDLLSKYKFKSICFEDFDFQDQVSIASRASFLISIHGAGLTNMLFMEPEKKVMEFRRAGDRTNLCYFSLASALHLGYYYQCGEIQGYPKSNWDANLYIEISQLKRNIERMLDNA